MGIARGRRGASAPGALTAVAALLCALTAVAAVLCALAPSAGAVVVRAPGGKLLGITPRSGVNPASIPGVVAGKRARASRYSLLGGLDYGGGPVLHSSAPYLVFWDPANQIPARSRTLLERYLMDVAADSGKASNVYGVARQYTDVNGFADYRQTFNAAQAITDPQPYPSQDFVNCPDTGSSFPTCITDAQLQAELKRLVGANGLPTGTGPNAPVYLIVTPPSVNICAPDFSTPTPCADNVFCAYHSFVSGGDNMLYAVIPMLVLGQSQAQQKSCQADGNSAVQEPNHDGADVVLKYLSHEDNEAITDPLFSAWFNTSNGNENGDNCNKYGAANPGAGTSPTAFGPPLERGGDAGAGTLFNQVINGNPYYLQSEWSNGDLACDIRPPAGTVNAGFSAPSSAPIGAPFTFNPSTSTNGQDYSSVTWSFGDGSPPLFTPGTVPTPVSHAYGTAGIHTVTLTLVDTLGNLSVTSRNVIVGSPPVARFRFSPSKPGSGSRVSFSGVGSSNRDSGVSISSFRWNFGDGSRIGSGVAPNHSYAAPGSYTVTLTVTNSLGLSSSSSGRVIVDETPTVAFSARSSQPASGRPSLFKASARDPDGSIRSYSWSFGDHTPRATGVSPQHRYRHAGIYLVTLTVTDSSGMSATVIRKFRIAHSGQITASK